jgi:uncharacterized protein YndB with AHSA1/START domain
MARSDVETVEREIASPPDTIFALLSDARRHRDIDGSGTVVEATGESEPLALGSVFGMSMHLGIRYTTANTVTEFEPARRIAWQTRPTAFYGRFTGGRTWRYELEPTDGGTIVRESWDISTEAPLSRPLVRRAAQMTRRNMEQTLERIDKLVTSA